MLSPYRVLDLADERGLLCGQILADLGADTVAVEPPEGNPARRRGPFADAGEETDGERSSAADGERSSAADGERSSAADGERSLYWWAFGRNRRSITADVETLEGRDLVRRLVARSHFFIESQPPGRLAELGLGYAQLKDINPGLVYVSITAFGQDGPKARYAESDLVVGAAGGMLYGDPDRPPVRIALPQAYLHAGAEAAGAALVAHRERQRSGLGQHVDVSAQQAVAQATQSFILASAIGDTDPERLRGGVRLGPLEIPQVWAVEDGYVSLTVLFGAAFGPFTRRLMEWVHEEGCCDEATRDKDWIGLLEALLGGKEPLEEYHRVLAVVREFIRTKTKAELLAAALERKLLIAPFSSLDEMVVSEQLSSRDYWQPIRRGGRAGLYPGPFAKLSESPIRYRRPAPRVGEHQEEVLAELEAGHPPPLPTPSDPVEGELPLSGLKVVDLMWVMAGPAATRVLADYGATVVRVESARRPDTARTFQPFHDGQPGLDSSGLFLNMNVGKLGITLDLTRPQGRQVLLDLVQWADVVGESFSPKAMQAWGLDYAALRARKPDLIMFSSSLFGQSGALSLLSGFGNMAAAITGFNSLAGWPDREPALVGAYTDYVSPRFSVAVLLAALDYRDRTGRGQYIDLSQAEASLHFLAPAFLDYTVNGRVWGNAGNRDPHKAPHGIYPAAGEDHWVAMAVTTDDEWQALCLEMDRPELATDPRFATLEARCVRAEELDGRVAAWTRERPMHELEARLQARGIAAHAVEKSAGLRRDPQLFHRRHFVELPHPVHGTTTVESSRFVLSRTPARIERAAPGLGRDNDLVLGEILGYDAARIAQLAADEILR